MSVSLVLHSFKPSYTFSVQSHLPAGYPAATSYNATIDPAESGGESEDSELVSIHAVLHIGK